MRTIMLRLGYASVRRRWPVGAKAGKVWMWLTQEQAKVEEAEGAKSAVVESLDFTE